MDTRTKIVTAAEAARIAEQGATVVSGYFDPLLAAQAERLAGIEHNGAGLLVAIADPGNPILPARARAELVAGLAAVDYVVEGTASLKIHLRLEDEHKAQSAELIERVQARNGAASAG